MRKCFLVTPIGDAYSKTREKCDELYSEVIVPAFNLSYNITVAHKICKTGDINKDVISHIRNDDLVIANLTDLNRNVLFELGVRYGLDKPFILVAEEGTALPFDLNHERTFFYSPDSNGYAVLCNNLKRIEKTICYHNNRKLEKYEGRWLEIIFDFTERPVALCRLSYDKAEKSYKLRGRNYHISDHKKDVDFESNLIIDAKERRLGFYYITHPTVMESTTGFGKINFLGMKQDKFTVAEGYFIDILNTGDNVSSIRRTKMIKCDKHFLHHIGLEDKKIRNVQDSTIIKYSQGFLEKNYGIKVDI